MRLNVCECRCHKDGERVLHCFPCCQMCGEKYITEDGEMDWIRVGKAMRKHGIKGDYAEEGKE